MERYMKQTKNISERYVVALFSGDGDKVETSIHVWQSESGFSAFKQAHETPAAHCIYKGMSYERGLAMFRGLETEADVNHAILTLGNRSNR